jgi:signal transduction histidine kinase/CheY-like chemotaxis protein
VRPLRDVSIRAKLVVGLGLLTLLVVSAAAVGYCGLWAAESQLIELSARDDELFRLARLSSSLYAVRAKLLEMITAGDAEKQTARHVEIIGLSAEIDGLLEDLLHRARGADVPGRLEAIRRAWHEYRTLRDRQVISAVYSWRLPEARELAVGTQEVRFLAPARQAADLLDRLITDARQETLDFKRQGERRYSLSLALFIGLSGLAGLLAVALTVFYNRLINRPLVSLVSVLERVASGDLTVAVKAQSRDEVGRVAEATADMVTRLRTVLSRTVWHERVRALGEVAAGVAHEFNNLLAVTLGQAELLLLDERPPREGLAVIRQAALDGRETVRRLQHFTGGGQPEERQSCADPCRTVEEVIAFAAPQWKYQAQARGVSYDIVTDLAPTRPARLSPSLLREVLLNLLLNALEAMPGGGRVGFRVRQDADDLEISVWDTGRGIPEATRTRIFDPFFTTKSSTASGLGLTICSQIVAGCGGALEVDSQPGHGATFTIVLPASSAPTAAAARPGEPPPRLPSRASILLIDADSGARDSTARALRGAGHDVEAVGTGAAGIARYRQRRFDCVITDLVMPGLSGLTVSRAVKDHRPETCVVLLAGERVEADQGRAAGVDRIVMKPASPERLLEMFSARPA